MIRRVLIPIFLAACPVVGFAQITGFGDIPFGSDEALVKEKSPGKLLASAGLNAKRFNQSDTATLYGMVLAPPVKLLRFRAERGEEILYFFSDQKLTGVIHTLGGKTAFTPKRFIRGLEATYETIEKKEVKDLKFPSHWGSFDPVNELPLAYDWETNEARIRVACRAWPVNDLRKILRVIYSSKTQNEINRKRMETLAAEEAAAAKAAADAKAAKEAARAAPKPR